MSHDDIIGTYARALADAGFHEQSLSTREKIAGELRRWPIGRGFSGTTVPTDEAQEIADAVLDLLKDKTHE